MGAGMSRRFVVQVTEIEEDTGVIVKQEMHVIYGYDYEIRRQFNSLGERLVPEDEGIYS